MVPNRLSVDDLTNLALEAPDTLMHQAGLGVLDAGPLVDADGRIRIEALRSRLRPKVQQTPELQQVLHPTGFLQGRPLWIDDPEFKIENHVHLASLPPPGGLPAALRFVEATLGELMDRSRPLWQLWFLEGYAPGLAAMVLKTHHALLDGPAMLNLIAQLFDLEPNPAPPPAIQWTPVPPPSARALVADNFRVATGDLGRGFRRLGHPIKLARTAGATLRGGWETVRQGRGAPVTSLNRPIGSRRRFAVSSVPLRDVERVAHGSKVKVNDVFLDLVAGGLRTVLQSRGEPVDGVTFHASIAVSMHPAGDGTTMGNNVGTVLVPLPLGDPDPVSRLQSIAAGTAVAKARQRAVVTPAFMSLLAQSGVTRRYIRRQRMLNVLTTNLRGPTFPLYVAGARVLEIYAAPPIAGNVTVSFAALSYEGDFNLSVVADAAAWPDLDVLVDGIRSCWLELSRPSVLLAAGL